MREDQCKLYYVAYTDYFQHTSILITPKLNFRSKLASCLLFDKYFVFSFYRMFIVPQVLVMHHHHVTPWRMSWGQTLETVDLAVFDTYLVHLSMSQCERGSFKQRPFEWTELPFKLQYTVIYSTVSFLHSSSRL